VSVGIFLMTRCAVSIKKAIPNQSRRQLCSGEEAMPAPLSFETSPQRIITVIRLAAAAQKDIDGFCVVKRVGGAQQDL
jgi:hypothetical protein